MGRDRETGRDIRKVQEKKRGDAGGAAGERGDTLNSQVNGRKRGHKWWEENKGGGTISVQLRKLEIEGGIMII